MKRNAVKQIATNVQDEFASLFKEIQPHLRPEVDVSHARALLSEHVPTLVVCRAQLILDTLLNYLMTDAIDTLSSAPTSVKQSFYELNLRSHLKIAHVVQPQTLQFSTDPRIIGGSVAAGGMLIAGGLIVSLLLSGVTVRIITGLASIVASAIAFRLAHAACTNSARSAVESDISKFLAQSESQILEWLATVELSFIEDFDKFTVLHGIQSGEPR